MKKKLIFIGNSIVAGYPWSKGKSFVSLARKACTGLEIINKGVNGDTTAGIMHRFKTDVLDHDPDVVFFLTGTNDFIYREATPQEAFENLELMANLAISAGAVPVYITPLPVDADKAEVAWMAGMGIMYEAVNRQLDELAGMMETSGRLCLDFAKDFAAYADEIGDPELVYLDGLHPMPGGHEFLAGKLIEFLEINEEDLWKPTRN